MSQSIETYSPAARRDLGGVPLHDAGDVPLAGLAADEAMERIARTTERLAGAGALVVSLGGDHSVSIGVARGAARVHPELAHLVLDAHLDFRPAYQGSEYSHACGTRHMSDLGPTVVLGARSGSRVEWAEAAGRLAALTTGLDLSAEGRRALDGRPIHVSVDLDVLDPGVAPGVGNPEPGGADLGALRDALLGLSDLRIVALDVTEVCPPLDPTGASAVAAAGLIRDVLAARVGM